MRILIGKHNEAHTSFTKGKELIETEYQFACNSRNSTYQLVQREGSVVTKSFISGALSVLLSPGYTTHRFNVRHLTPTTRLELKAALNQGHFNYTLIDEDKPYTKELSSREIPREVVAPLSSLVTRSKLPPHLVKCSRVLCSEEPLPAGHVAAVYYEHGLPVLLFNDGALKWNNSVDVAASIVLLQSGLAIKNLKRVPFISVPPSEIKPGCLYGDDSYAIGYYHPDAVKSTKYQIFVKGV